MTDTPPPLREVRSDIDCGCGKGRNCSGQTCDGKAPPQPLTAESETLLNIYAPITTLSVNATNGAEWAKRTELRNRLAAIEAAAATQAAASLPRELTRLVMGEWFIKLDRWMTTGWRETMADEGEALFTELLALARHVAAAEET